MRDSIFVCRWAREFGGSGAGMDYKIYTKVDPSRRIGGLVGGVGLSFISGFTHTTKQGSKIPWCGLIT